MAQQQPTTALTTTTPKAGIIAKFGERYDLEPAKVMSIVAATVFKQGKDEAPLTPEETAAALIVANAYELNPFTKELYAFRSKGKLLIVVSLDGWSRIVNRQEQLNGIEFEEHFNDDGKILAVTCKIHRKDCALPVVVTEYTHECKRNTEPWNNMPIRMTRNRAFIQCARLAFSVAGVIDDDEAQTIEGSPEFVTSHTKAIIDGAPSKTQAIKDVARAKAQGGRQQAQQQVQPEVSAQQEAAAQQTVEAQPEVQVQEDQPAQPETKGELW